MRGSTESAARDAAAVAAAVAELATTTDGDESAEEAAGAKRAAPAGGRAQSKKRGTTKSLRIGIIAGKVDDDCCVAPNIPESHWVSEAAARREEVHSEYAQRPPPRFSSTL